MSMRHFLARLGRLGPAAGVGLVIATGGLWAASKPADRAPQPLAAEQPDSVPATTLAARDLVQPDELARMLAGPASRRPMLLHVGFKVLYRSGHIPGSRYAGPASKPESLATLRNALRPLSRQTPVVLYCGCCPWEDCPNVVPALRIAHAMGFKQARVLYVSRNLEHDWIDRGLPTTDPER
jgi:thiosulfate/3-mercaptopyruvate sulfurtransferase